VPCIILLRAERKARRDLAASKRDSTTPSGSQPLAEALA